jgi:hypothetical protein
MLAIVYVLIASQRMLDRTYPKGPSAADAATTPGALAQGGHLVVVATCTDCHGKDPTGTLLPVPGSTVYAPNLTVATNNLSDADIGAMSQIARGNLSSFTDDEIGAI